MAWFVQDLMTPAPSTVGADRPAREAVAMLRTLRVRHLPVVDGEGQLVGILSDRDVLRHTDVDDEARIDPDDVRIEPLDGQLVRDLMTWVVMSVAPDLPLADAGRRMLQSKRSCLPVLQGDELVGILTESDFVRALVELAEDEE